MCSQELLLLQLKLCLLNALLFCSKSSFLCCPCCFFAFSTCCFFARVASLLGHATKQQRKKAIQNYKQRSNKAKKQSIFLRNKATTSKKATSFSSKKATRATKQQQQSNVSNHAISKKAISQPTKVVACRTLVVSQIV